MKYRLKKDLPFAKAGEEVIIDSLCVYTMGDVFNAGAKRQTKIYLGDIFGLTEYGWIEEVKPREWETNIINGCLTGTTTGQYWTGDVKVERIKVREVLE